MWICTLTLCRRIFSSSFEFKARSSSNLNLTRRNSLWYSSLSRKRKMQYYYTRHVCIEFLENYLCCVLVFDDVVSRLLVDFAVVPMLDYYVHNFHRIQNPQKFCKKLQNELFELFFKNHQLFLENHFKSCELVVKSWMTLCIFQQDFLLQ